MPRTQKGTRARRAKKDAQRRNDNRPWWDRATDRDFLQLGPGTYTLIITGPAIERVNNFGNQVVDIPTQKGVLSTGAFSVLRPLAKLVKTRGQDALHGARITFTVTGEGLAKRYNNVQVQT